MKNFNFLVNYIKYYSLDCLITAFGGTLDYNFHILTQYMSRSNSIILSKMKIKYYFTKNQKL